ncbi:Type 1 glutamine amidotransferase-like domain-containing protein [Microlunatus sp. Gsoil 973]|uniref:Type 1 glutamine amidotransferase-like domain-containing protein n=1 Tax=Microlunatus sp. Gsoil 973 TaxID=2672569 RepID=UPI0018A85E96|nr:Type 1 glutamine amidotransferase-like domain-containing protein [Microlunatus sp. Gsoil 973]
MGNAPEELIKLFTAGNRIAVIANGAYLDDPAKHRERVESELAELREIGLEPAELDLQDYFGQQSRLRSDLEGFDGLWVLGGNVLVLRTAFRESGADEIIRDRLSEDSLVYAGYSAGGCLLGPEYPLLDELFVQLPGYPDELLTSGLGIVPFTISPHYGTRAGSAGATRVTDYYIEHHIPFIALRDGQAIVINGNTMRVVD